MENKELTKNTGTSATRAKNKYNAKVYDHIHLTAPKGKKEEIAKAAKEQGYKSVNEFILAAIEEKRIMTKQKDNSQ